MKLGASRGFCRCIKTSPMIVLSDTTVFITSVKGGAQEPQKWVPGQGAGVAGGGWRRGPQGLLSGRVLQRFVEQLIDEDGVFLAVVDVPVICSDKFLQFLFFGVEVPQLTYREILQVQFLEKVVDVLVEFNVDSVHRQSQWTFQFATRRVSFCMGMAAVPHSEPSTTKSSLSSRAPLHN